MAYSRSGTVNVDTLGEIEVQTTGNCVALGSSAIIHYIYSKFIDPQDYDFSKLDEQIQLVEEDNRGLTDEDKDEAMLRRSERWIVRRGYILSLILVVIWPLLSIPARVFTQKYFAFWVLVAIAWGFGAAIVITLLPLVESSEEILTALSGMYYYVRGKEAPQAKDPAEMTGDLTAVVKMETARVSDDGDDEEPTSMYK